MATGQYQMKWRAQHSTVINSDRLYCWGGEQEDLPMIHYNDEKRKFTSSVDIFHLPALKWERTSTTATPPAGVMNYACTNIRDSILYFGGRCQRADCFHNDLFELNTLTNEWREIINISPDNGPMRKSGCGMISFNMNGEGDNLLAIGGFGPTPMTAHTGSKYIPSPIIPNLSITNEIHTVCVNSIPGQWKVPIIIGNRPPPCAGFSINTLPGNGGVMFGGFTIDETGFRHVNDLFLLSISQNTIDFMKVVKPSVTILKWPRARNRHASTIMNTISSNNQTISHLILLGGLDDHFQTLNDCWIMNLSSFIWYQINLSDSVTKRFAHSMSTYYISKERFWIIVTGGYNGYNQSDNTLTPITGFNIIVIIELEYINGEWSVKHVWNYEQLMKNKNEIQKSLIHHIVDDRLQEGTLVTHLFGSLKSSSSITHQLFQETQQRMFEKKMFEKESELLKLSVEMREKSDEITNLKTREMSLIDKSDTLEKELGFLKDETQAYKRVSIATRQELQGSQTLLMIEKKTSLAKTQQITDLKEKLKLTCTLSSDEETMEAYYEKTLEREPLEEKKSKLVDEDKPKSDISDKMLILEEEIESLQSKLEKKDKIVKELESIQQLKPLQAEIFDKTSQVEELRTLLKNKTKELESLQEQLTSLQTTVVSKNEQVEELQSKLEKKDEIMKELESIQEPVKSHQTTVDDKPSQTDEVQNTVENDEVHLEELQMQRERIRELEVTIQEMKQLEKTRKTSLLVPQSSSDIISIPDDPDLHIAKQKVFHIKGNTLDWGDYGFNMSFPEGTIPPSQVLIKALVGGKFLFPDDVELVSALYVIQFPENFLQPVELEIQHCVAMKSLQQLKYLSFVIAPTNESVPPYKFQFIEGGKFYTDSQYGKIVRSKFSITGIVLKSNGDSVHTSSDEEEQSPSDPSSDTDSDDDESTGSTDSSSEDKNPTSNTTQTTSGDSEHANIQSTKTTDSLPPEDKNLTSEIQTTIEHVLTDTVSNTDDIEDREDISSDNQETHEEVKRKNIDDISTENSITSPDILEEKSDENDVKTNNDDIINTPDTQLQKQKKTSSINYGGKIFYESRGKNRWLMRFISVKDLNALSKYVLTHHPQAEVDQSVSFKFSYESYYLELIMDKKQEKPFNEWVISPHSKQCKLSKVSMDTFGRSDSDGLPDPPSCLVSVYADNEQKATKLLSYAVPLKGVVSLEEEIFITRFLETTDTSRTVQQFGASPNPTGTDRSRVDTSQVIRCIELVMEKNHAKLTRLFKTGSLKTVADELLEAGIITRDVQTNPTSDNIINCFLSGFVFKDDLEEIEEYCTKFFNTFYEIRGPYVDAANKIKKSIQESVRDKLGIQLNV